MQDSDCMPRMSEEQVGRITSDLEIEKWSGRPVMVELGRIVFVCYYPRHLGT